MKINQKKKLNCSRKLQLVNLFNNKKNGNDLKIAKDKKK